MTKRFKPERSHGVLFDADGNVALRFGSFKTRTHHEAPEYVETDRQPEYVLGPAEHSNGEFPLEASPRREDLPDPAKPPTDEHPTPEFARSP